MQCVRSTPHILNDLQKRVIVICVWARQIFFTAIACFHHLHCCNYFRLFRWDTLTVVLLHIVHTHTNVQRKQSSYASNTLMGLVNFRSNPKAQKVFKVKLWQQGSVWENRTRRNTQKVKGIRMFPINGPFYLNLNWKQSVIESGTDLLTGGLMVSIEFRYNRLVW